MQARRSSLPFVLLVSLLFAASGYAAPAASVSVSYPASAVSGTAFTYHVTFTNTGSVGGAVEYFQSVPGTPSTLWWIDGVTQTSGPAFQCSFTPRVDCFLSDFAPGASASFDVTLHTHPLQTAPIDVRNSLIALDSGVTTATDTHTVPLTQSADLATNITGPAVARVGDDAAYSITVSDLGPSAAGGTLTITIPSGLAFQSFVAGPAISQCTAPAVGASGTMTCSFAGIYPAVPHNHDPGFGVGMSLHVKPLAAGSMTIAANAAGDAADPSPANNQKSVTTDVTENGVADLSVTLHADKTSAVVSTQTVTYDAAVKNNGPTTASNVKLTVSIPAGAVLAAPAPACSGTPLVCADAVLPAGQTVHWTYSLRFTAAGNGTSSVTATSDAVDPDSSNNSASVTVSARVVSADLRVIVTPSRTTANPGDEVVYSLVVANNGPDTVPQAALTVTLPAGSMLTASYPGCAQSGNVVTCTFANLSTTGAATLQLSAAAPPSAAPFVVPFTVSSSAPDPDPTNNTVTVSIPMASAVPSGESDVRVTVTSEPTVVNGVVHFVVTTTNFGPAAASNVTSRFQLAGTNIAISNTELPPNANIKCINYFGSGPSCVASTLAAGEFFISTITVTTGGAGVVIQGTARAASGTHDPDLSNNIATATPAILAPALNVSVNPPSATVTLGQTVTHTIAISNSGTASADPATVREQWVSGFSVTSVTSSTGTCSNASDGFTCILGALAPGAQATVTVTGKAPSFGTWSGAISAFVPLSGGGLATTTYSLTVTAPPHHRAAGH